MLPARRIGLLTIRLAVLAILGLIIINPVRVDETQGAVELPKLFYLLDASQSMAIGKDATRWDQAVETIRTHRTELRIQRDRRPGQHVPVRQPAWPLSPRSSAQRTGDSAARPGARRGIGLSPSRNGGPKRPRPRPIPTRSGRLSRRVSRTGSDRPRLRPLVVFSDGRTRDPDRTEKIARAYARMNIPVHVVPRRRRKRGRRCRHRQHGRSQSGPEALEGLRAGLRSVLRI